MLKGGGFNMWNKFLDFLHTELKINPNYKDSRDDAKNRLKLVLMNDRSKLAPGTVNKMKEELFDVITRYIQIDKTSLSLKFDHQAHTLALSALIATSGTDKQPVSS